MRTLWSILSEQWALKPQKYQERKEFRGETWCSYKKWFQQLQITLSMASKFIHRNQNLRPLVWVVTMSAEDIIFYNLLMKDFNFTYILHTKSRDIYLLANWAQNHYLHFFCSEKGKRDRKGTSVPFSNSIRQNP